MLSPIQSGLNTFHPENYIPFDETMQFNNSKNPEEIVIEKDLFEKLLSDKAKQTVYIICQEPFDSDNQVRHRDVSWSRIKKYLHDNYGMTGNDFKKIKREIGKWLKS